MSSRTTASTTCWPPSAFSRRPSPRVGRVVVYASSSSVYGDAPGLPLTEDGPCQPVSPYGVTKLAAEHLAVLYHRCFGLPTVSLRYFTVYGPRQRPDMAFHRFLSAARDGGSIHLYGDGEQTRDFTFVVRHRRRHPGGRRFRSGPAPSITLEVESASR